MGYALAKIASNMGAEVTLVTGVSALMPPKHANSIVTKSADSMYQAVMQHISDQDIFIGVAAVADYSPVETSTQKIKKSEDTLTLQLKRNKDILADVANLPHAPFCVGFAAESENIIEYAKQKRLSKKLPLIVANEVTSAMGSDNNQVTLIDDQGVHPLQAATKAMVAAQILEHISRML
jgi:phosphopantothenoylcysteine decarboxylase / phosphopantothenate---cysteine ligase